MYDFIYFHNAILHIFTTKLSAAKSGYHYFGDRDFKFMISER